MRFAGTHEQRFFPVRAPFKFCIFLFLYFPTNTLELEAPAQHKKYVIKAKWK